VCHAIPEAVLDSVEKEDWEPLERKKRNEDSRGTSRVNKGGNGVNKKQPPRKNGSRSGHRSLCVHVFTQHMCTRFVLKNALVYRPCLET